ncbi:hypothetical protein [uncultured Flavobacterium sp.]|uniref:hypothetical protein n=1 Tax=uncultured Flavobacterium sp. TaxID=165435 RepID=UPI0026091955|nr:hypothetical protein [uncultured Flavobacterium sp.]
MKILTWNVQRLEKNENKKIAAKLYGFGADIIVLTETSSILNLGENYNYPLCIIKRDLFLSC